MASVDPADLENPPSPPQELMGLFYERLVVPFLGSIQELTRIVQELESLVTHMKWMHALQEGYGYIQKGLQVNATGKSLYQAGQVILPMLL